MLNFGEGTCFFAKNRPKHNAFGRTFRCDFSVPGIFRRTLAFAGHLLSPTTSKAKWEGTNYYRVSVYHSIFYRA
jgi:hypothetical protein